MKRRISSNDLRAAADKLMYAKGEYCRQFKFMDFNQVEAAESCIEAAYDMLVLTAQKLKEITCKPSISTR